MRVFLSHSYEDNDIASKVRNYLAHHDLTVFDDKADIATGASLNASISQAISDSDVVLFFVSKNSEKSQWIQQEMSLAVSNRLKGKDVKLIPIVLDRNAEIPFFLKDYLYLDMSKSKDFDISMKKLVDGIKSNSKTSVKQDLEATVANIEIEKELLKIKSLEHEEFKKFKTRQMFFVSMIVTLVSAIVASVGLLGWLAKVDYSNFEWIIAFLAGAMASMFGSIIYMKKEKPNKNELNKKINDLHEMIKKMEARHDR
ncbi:toll/interleukin-1 receptor domain-containing protein [Shewanella frigidimarina]|uniref:TIR domain-containing protein n=1 Tax=Shewanella frigidimarina TaxID=56812 RepID=A0A106C2W1_SHEFR|nr:toll/interleukin-1 receptor domain-containing protein [Shewanella frigidimarina]KVX03221.1 hypothetical protein AWJ07_01215 [Shewanella frigidimarina]